MKLAIAAAFALTAASPLAAQTPAAAIDYQYAAPLPGTWTYAPAAGGSEATFRDSASRPQLFVRCTRSARLVTIAKPATGAAPFITVWTTSQTRSVPASYNPATYRLSANVLASDALLDAMVFSRGRIAFIVQNQPALIVPPWEEIARVVEDCRG